MYFVYMRCRIHTVAARGDTQTLNTAKFEQTGRLVDKPMFRYCERSESQYLTRRFPTEKPVATTIAKKA